ncbi:MAG: 16S rRNA (guanine(966)-N(2))-methyltransferase RsmD [Alphaproteobacteria bacterium]
MRIGGGNARGRRLAAPAGGAVRPTSGRVRRSLFDILLHGEPGLAEARVLDAFAGTGALGLEALSRGAATATFFDIDRTALEALRANVAALGAGSRAFVRPADATRPPRADAPADIVMLDPPYRSGLGGKALAALAAAGWIGAGTLVAWEQGSAFPEAAPEGFTEIDRRRYGGTTLVFLRRAAS